MKILSSIPFQEEPIWTENHTRIASRALTFCEDFPQIARRFEAWWHQDLVDRPIFIGMANKNPGRPITRRLELLHDPEAWLEEKYKDLHQLHWVADAVPFIRVDFGPVFLGGLLGGKLEFVSNTTWTHPIIADDWSNAVQWNIDEENRWWNLLRTLSDMLAEKARDHFLVCSPSPGGAADILLNLRGADKLCIDILDKPETIKRSITDLFPIWHQVFSELYQITCNHNAGLIHWLQLWSNQPYIVSECDFGSMIGPKEFRNLFLPDITRQAETVGRSVFHLDGPNNIRHLDSLLEIPKIRAIQFTPGAGTPSALKWIKMFRNIQESGRSVLVICPPEEVIELCEQLQPEGLGILLDKFLPPEQLDELYLQFCRPFQ